jgi:carboxyl-terminal processing protease
VAIIKPAENASFKCLNTSWRPILYAGKTKLFGRKLPSDSLFSSLKGERGSVVDVIIYRKSERKRIKLQKRGNSLKVSRQFFYMMDRIYKN